MQCRAGEGEEKCPRGWEQSRISDAQLRRKSLLGEINMNCNPEQATFPVENARHYYPYFMHIDSLQLHNGLRSLALPVVSFPFCR